jgi:aldose 1-epimerase
MEGTPMILSEKKFGITRDGKEITLIKMESGRGGSVSLINYGAAIQSIAVPDKNGQGTDVCLGYNTIEGYENDTTIYLGVTIGRYANRIAKGRFTLNGREYRLDANNGSNHLHGGFAGFNKRVFDYSVESGNSVIFTYFSPDGEGGYPGNLNVTVRFSFSETHELKIDYEAQTDADTPINLTNHAYFNLNGEGNGSILDHILRVNATKFTEVDSSLIPTGQLMPVAGTPMDFLRDMAIGARINDDYNQLRLAGGYDLNYVLDSAGLAGASPAEPAAVLYSSESMIKMEVYTTKPGIQLYTGNYLQQVEGKSGTYDRYSGLCLETQYFPDSVNQPGFPQSVLKAGERYSHSTIYAFSATQ